MDSSKNMDFLLHISQFGAWPYLVVFIGMLFEGTMFLLTTSFLIAQGALNPIYAIPLLVAGSFMEELMWYEIGRRLSNWKKVSDWADRLTQRFDPHILNSTFRIFAISKYIYAMHRPVIARAGMLKMTLKKFIPPSFVSTAIWLVVIGSLGFAFSASFNVLRKNIKYAELIPLAILLVAFGLEKYFSPRLKKEL